MDQSAALTGFIWHSGDGGGGGGNGPDGDHEYQSRGVHVVASPELLAACLQNLKRSFEQTARQTTTIITLSDEHLSGGYVDGFALEYTFGKARGRIVVKVASTDTDPDDPSRRVYYMRLVVNENRP